MTTTLTRTDIHRPSAIDPIAYEFVGVEVARDDGDIGAALMAGDERRRIRAHMAATGGDYSRHAHGGNCHVCGAHAIYTVLWYHADTNTYIRTGEDCADKLWSGDDLSFTPVRQTLETIRGEVRTARENRAGKMKAQCVLADAGLSRAWEIYTATPEALEHIGATIRRQIAACECPHSWKADTIGHTCATCGDVRTAQDWTEPTRELGTLRDIIDRLVRYGDISEKAEQYLATLVDTIDNRTDRERAKAARDAAEREAALDCPNGRVELIGQPVSIKQQDGGYGPTVKCLLKTRDGFKVWGTVPASILDELHAEDVLSWNDYGDRARVGDGIRLTFRFTATVSRSDGDAKFGFYKRPSRASVEIIRIEDEL